MNNYFIKKIKLQNFKLIEGSKTIDFKDHRLIVLDGPNGYGKTTIFDAIEILIKGYRNIDQSYITEYREGDKPVIYAYDMKKQVSITGEFEDNSGNNLIISRIIKDPAVDGKISQLKDRFSLYKLKKFNDFSGKKICQNYINKEFNLNPNEEIYNLTHYMQQEDSIFFLKKKENERREEMNKLFNMNNSTKLQSKISKIRQEINRKRKHVEENKKKIKERIKDMPQEKHDEIKYKRLIDWKDIIWDRKDIVINNDNYNKIVDELNDIKSLIKYKEDFINFKFNEKLNNVILDKNEETLKGSIILLNNLSDYNKIIKNNDKNKKFRKFEKLLKNKDYTKIYKFIEQEIELLEETYQDINFNQMRLDIDNLLKVKKDNSDLDELINNISDIRDNLVLSFKQFTNKGHKNHECPLCGYDYETLDKDLFKEIDNKEIYFKEKLNKAGDTSRKICIKLENKYITKLLKKLEQSILSTSVNIKLVEQLKFYYYKKHDILEFEEYCSKLNISLDDFKLEKLEYDEYIINENIKKIKNILLRHFKEIKYQEYIALNKDKLDKIFQTTFDNQFKKMDEITMLKLENKELFIKSIYFQELYGLKTEYDKLKKQYKILDDLYSKFNKIKNIYDKEIYEYSEYMISKLQIPIYIYSGKIIQDYQGGLGIFIKTEQGKDNQIRLKFVNNNNSKHDVINRFSSGQLSGVVISILLSLNQTFSLNYLNLILIDDPLQSMDDINMASFVELLRNEFKDKQIIISTHDERISRYIRYKYSKSGISSLRYNVKEQLNKY